MSDRYLRFEGTFLDRQKLKASTVLLGGAGALGNEVAKNLAMLGVGRVMLVDFDTVELHNLTRSVLLCLTDLEEAIRLKKPKADFVAAGMKTLNPDVRTQAINLDIGWLGPGVVRKFDVVISTFDNPVARLVLQERAARGGRTMVDGGLGNRRQEIASGSVTALRAQNEEACYGCILGESRRNQLLAQAFGDPNQLGCTRAAPKVIEQGGQPSTPMMASIIGGAQALLAAKVLMRDPKFPVAYGETSQWHLARAFRMESFHHRRDPSCPFHRPPAVQVFLPNPSSDITLFDLAEEGRRHFRASAVVDLPTELWPQSLCPSCQAVGTSWQTRLGLRKTACGECGHLGLEPRGEPLTAFHPDEHPCPQGSLSALGFCYGEQFELHHLDVDSETPSVRVELAGDFEALWSS